ncbi:terminase large subunit [Achromobacter phage emuu_LB7]|nr:terminase large subunit [Achromobacter phage emuu_LB7]
MLPRSSSTSSRGRYKEVWRAQEGSQELFLSSPVRETLYAGTRGPGKTDALLMDFGQHVGQGFGAEWRGILFRQTLPQLDDVIKKSRKWFPLIWPKAVYNKVDKLWTWPTGETLKFSYMNDPEDYWNYHGHAYPWIGWEELCNWINSECYTRMMSCCRSTEPNIPRKIRATTNPYGPGHNWVKKRWHLPHMFGKIVREMDDEGNPLPERVALHGSILENKILLAADPDYISNLRAAARNPQELRAWLHGDWDIVSGGAFDDVWEAKVHVKPRSKIPASWHVFRAFDWGTSRPFSVGWWAVANGENITLRDGTVWCPPRGSLVRIAEWYGTKELGTNKGLYMPAREVARGIAKREKQLQIEGWLPSTISIRPGPADNSIRDVEPGMTSTEDIMAEEKVRWEESDKSPGSRKVGLELARQMLYDAMHGNPNPGMYTFDNCNAFIQLLPTLPRDDDDPDDVNSDAEDHFWDETRYMVLRSRRRYSKIQANHPSAATVS